jgi:hypothetical protein
MLVALVILRQACNKPLVESFHLAVNLRAGRSWNAPGAGFTPPPEAGARYAHPHGSAK